MESTRQAWILILGSGILFAFIGAGPLAWTLWSTSAAAAAIAQAAITVRRRA